MNDLGLKFEVDRMLHVIGLLEFMYIEAPTYECITLEFLSTLDFHLQKKWLSDERYYFGTLKFRLFNQYREFPVEDLGSILRLPIYGPEDVPDEFPMKQFWTDITGNSSYGSTTAKPSGIQNPYFRYAQKGFAYTLFGRDNSTGVASQRELFFLYAMANNELVNVACHTPILSGQFEFSLAFMTRKYDAQMSYPKIHPIPTQLSFDPSPYPHVTFI